MTNHKTKSDEVAKLVDELYDAGFSERDIIDVISLCPGMAIHLKKFIKDFSSVIKQAQSN